MSRFMLTLVCTTLLLAGCKKDDNGPTGPQTPGAEDDAAEMIALSLAAPSNGVVMHIGEAVMVARYGTMQKRSGDAAVTSPQFDTTVVRSDSTQLGKYFYAVHVTYQFSDVRNRLDLSYDAHGSLDLPRFASVDTAGTVISVQHITDPDTTYLVNGTSVRSGTTTFKSRNLTVNSQLTVTFTNVLIGKNSYRVVGGNGVVVGTLRDSNGRTVAYSGTLTLTDTYQAILLLNGRQFTLSLITGTVISG